jgi:ubiquinone/menaquinone biosynthesis C-methylase UbiE
MGSKFLNPAEVVAQSGVMQGETVADLGCGNGFYVLPAAQMVGPSGTVIAVDVMEAKLAATVSIASQFGYKNVRIIQADLVKPLLDIPENSCDMVIVGNILHEIPQTSSLIQNIYRILKSPGRVLIVEWKKTAAPFGPPLDRRIEQQKVEILLMQAGLRKVKELDADSYHYAILFEK